MRSDNYVFFWGGVFSQWFPSNFIIDGVEYTSCEQYMMAKKAILFKDYISLDKIMNTKIPKEQKALGRAIKNFDKDKWEAVCREIVYEGNYAKFTQNPDLKDALLATGNKEIVEASPEDNIWGIGMRESHSDILDKSKWGTNWLGEAIMRVRKTILEEDALTHNVVVHRYHTPLEVVNSINRPSIFLAGPTVRGHQPHLTSWRYEAIEEFKRQGFEGDLIVPEFTSKTESDQNKAWVPKWEYNGLKASDCILFWIPRTRELIALTTNMEFGYWQGREPQKMVYGRPDDAYRMSYLDIMWGEVFEESLNYEANIYNTLKDTVTAAIKLADKRFNQK